MTNKTQKTKDKILLISNGHGEDLVAAEIIKKLREKGFSKEILVLPIVGEGKAFESLGVEVLGPRKKVPSGGFSLRNLSWLFRDLVAGILKQTYQHFIILKKLRGKLDLVVGIGDIITIAGALVTGVPFIFVGVNKSDYYQTFGYSYAPWEKWLLKRYARKVFARDEITADSLKRSGIKSEYVGNPLMDCVERSEIQDPRSEQGKTIIGFLPGTRDDVELNLEDFDHLTKQIVFLRPKEKKVKFMIAANKDILSAAPFNQVISQADIIIGLSGTGNEQAAGFGKPVVSFYGRGSQYTKKFALAQKELLGEALCLVEGNFKIVALTVWNILNDRAIYEKMSRAGKERMGSPGACEKICDRINT